jgi:pilus assembly protein CpaB
MSDRRYTAIFGAAIVTAAVATFAVYRMLGAAATPRREPTRDVVVVTRPIPAGVAVPRDAIALVPWPSRVAPAESFAAADSVSGRVAREPLRPGEPVLRAALAARGAAPGLEGAIAPDHRAMAVRVNEAAGVSGLVRPDSRVDVLMTVRDAGGGMSAEARVVVSDVRVLGVGPARGPEGATADGVAGAPLPANMASIVTLDVSPQQAAQLAAAESQGAIQVVLRGFGSVDAPSSVRGVAAGAAAAPAARSPLDGGDAPGRGPGSVTGTGARPRPDAGRASGHAARPHAAPARVASADAGLGTAPGGTGAPPRAARADARADAGRGEPTVVRVYRGGQLTVVPVESAESPAPAPTPAPAAAVRTASRVP